VWVPRNPGRLRNAHREAFPREERFIFLEEWYPKYGNLVLARYCSTRAIHRIVYQAKIGALTGSRRFIWTLTHIPSAKLWTASLEGIL